MDAFLRILAVDSKFLGIPTAVLPKVWLPQWLAFIAPNPWKLQQQEAQRVITAPPKHN